MKITAIVENTSNSSELMAEHGLSLYIEANGHKILFDMGQSELFYENARTLGIDLASVDTAIISHGHYDHGGGLRKFLEINSIAPIYMRSDAFLPYFNGTQKYIGLDSSLSKNPRIIFTLEKYSIDAGLELFSCNEEKRKHPPIPSGLTLRLGDVFINDPFFHEQYLLIEENKKKVLISGCSHKGILNIVEWFSPDVLIGGFHFSKLPLDTTLESYAKQLASKKTQFYTCHCTGTEQFEFMRQYIKDLSYLSCGDTVII